MPHLEDHGAADADHAHPVAMDRLQQEGRREGADEDSDSSGLAPRRGGAAAVPARDRTGGPDHWPRRRRGSQPGRARPGRAGAGWRSRRRPDLRRPPVQASDFLAEIGAEVGCQIVPVAVVGDAVEDVAADRPAAAGSAAGDVAVDREVERARGRGTNGVVAEERRLAQRRWVSPSNGCADRVAVDVEDLPRLQTPGDTGAADRVGEPFAAFVAATTAAPTSKFSLPVARHCRVVSIHCAGKTPNGRWP